MRGLTGPLLVPGPALRRRLGVAALALPGVLGGCYRFTPLAPPELGAAPAGALVRVALTEAGATALAPVVGTSVRALEGPIVRQAGDTLVVRADRLVTTVPGIDVAWSGGEVALPSAWRGTVERRSLARGRTALLVGGGVALSAGVLALVRALGETAGSPDGGGPGPVLSRQP